MLVAVGEAKIQSSYFKLAVMGLLAGFYVSFGFSFCAASIGLVSGIEVPDVGIICPTGRSQNLTPAVLPFCRWATPFTAPWLSLLVCS